MAILDMPNSACSTQAKKKVDIIPVKKDKFIESLSFHRK
jgi:hypothetical protein